MERNIQTADDQTSQFARIVKAATPTQLIAIGKLLTAVATGNDAEARAISAEFKAAVESDSGELAWKIRASGLSVAEYRALMGRGRK